MKDLVRYIWENKKWWMIPPIIIIFLVGLLIYISTATPISPFIYVLF